MGFIDNVVESKAYKAFMSKLYGWGASVVILGALFKIQHWPFAGPMLTAGLGTEALIFFFSAFEKSHVEPDWSLVYPELAHLYHPEEFEGEDAKELPTAKNKPVTEQLDDMLADAKIGPELIQSLSSGMQNLSENANKLSGVSDAAAATDGYVNNLTKAAESVDELSGAYKKSSEAMNQNTMITEDYVSAVKNATGSASSSSDAYKKVAETLANDLEATDEYVNSIKQATQSAQLLTDKYTQSAESLTKSAEAIDFSSVDGQAYADQLQNISKNLSALNSVYELQLQSSNEQLEKTQQLHEGMASFANNISESVENTNKYREELSALSQNLGALNKVYGNMLQAMTANPNA
jgi:gliding motility-associated protein GldL